MEKNISLNESYKNYIGSHVSVEGEKFLRELKVDALQNNAEYQALQKKLKGLKTSILRPIVNRFWAHKLAVAFSVKWKYDIEALENLIIDQNDNIIKDGIPYAISTIAEAASFMVYLHKTLTKSVTKQSDEAHEIYIEVKGGLEWLPLEAVCEKIAKKRKINAEYVLECYNKNKEKNGE